jgi:hypothetical protein
VIRKLGPRGEVPAAVAVGYLHITSASSINQPFRAAPVNRAAQHKQHLAYIIQPIKEQ